MKTEKLPFFIFNTRVEAKDAILSLNQMGFDIRKLSLVGRGYHSEEHPIGFYTTGDRIKSWGTQGAFWGGVWGLLFPPAFFMIPGLGLMVMAGPIVSILISALEGAVLVGGVSSLGAALSQIGVPKNSIIKYETALLADKYLLMVHGSVEDENLVRTILSHSNVEAISHTPDLAT